MSLIDATPFVSHSGLRLRWKFDADRLIDEDIAGIASLIAERFWFREVFGVPTGGIRLAGALVPYADVAARGVLIVDDVMTTAGSMETRRAEIIRNAAWNFPVGGFVILARCVLPPWVRCLLHEGDL